MTEVVCDASVVVKWFKERGESDVAPARAIRSTHESGAVTARVLDLTFLEVGNALTRADGWSARDVAESLDDLEALCGSGLRLTPYRRTAAADVAAAFGLSFYDAAYFAVATLLDFDLVSSDSDLIKMDAEAPATYCERLGLPVG